MPFSIVEKFTRTGRIRKTINLIMKRHSNYFLVFFFAGYLFSNIKYHFPKTLRLMNTFRAECEKNNQLYVYCKFILLLFGLVRRFSETAGLAANLYNLDNDYHNDVLVQLTLLQTNKSNVKYLQFDSLYTSKFIFE